MNYNEFQNIKLSALGMGAMRLPVVNGDDGTIDYEKAKAIIDTAMHKGINYYDTAYIYHNGQSERFLGQALASYPRDSFHVADKYNIHANPDYKAQFEEQLRRLQFEHIDFYLMHGIQDAFLDTVIQNGSIEYFDQMKKEGKIKYLGFSYHGTVEAFRKIVNAYSWDFVQIQLNYYDWYFGDAKALYDISTECNIPVMVMEPVHGGLLANMDDRAEKLFKDEEPELSVASWAMRWVMNLENVCVVLSGMSDLPQLEDNIKTFSQNPDAKLTSEEQRIIKEAAEIQHDLVAVPCTACRYCVPSCPQGLDIPVLLKAYNEAKIGGAWRLSSLMAFEKEKWPSACIGCGACTTHCPQSIDIPKYMSEMTEMMKMFA